MYARNVHSHSIILLDWVKTCVKKERNCGDITGVESLAIKIKACFFLAFTALKHGV